MGISPSSISHKTRKFTWCDTSGSLHITYDGKRIKVFPLYSEVIEVDGKKYPFTDKSMVVDEQGILYMSFWEKDKESVTPGQRTSKKLSVSYKVYHRYMDGLASLERAVRAALFNAVGNTDILTDSYLLCDAIGTQLQGSVSLKELTSKEMLRYLEQFEEQLAQKSSPPLSEARDKVQDLLLWVRDKEGKPKLVIFRTKWTAILDRHRERIETIQAWSKVYAARLFEIILIRERFSAMLFRLQLQIIMLKSSCPANGQMSDAYKELILDLTAKFTLELNRWCTLRPYNRWTTHMLRDVGKLENAVRGNSRVIVKNLLEKLDLAIHMKEFQAEIDSFNQYLSPLTMRKKNEKGKIKFEYEKDVSEKIHLKFHLLSQFIYGTDDKTLGRRVMPYIKKLWSEYQDTLKKQRASWRKMSFTRHSQHELLRELLRQISRLL